MSDQNGLNLKEYFLNVLDGDIDRIGKLIQFSPDELTEYRSLLSNFKEINGSAASNEEKGSSLENLVKFTIDKSVVFESYRNVHTSSNEIDILVRLNARGHYLKSQGLININENLLAECKNYNKSVAATWVGKFYTLMNYTHNDLGILFSYHGLSGKGWNDGTGLTKKVLLSDKKSYIIDFNKKDFELLATGDINFIELIRDKMFILKSDISFDALLDEHPNQHLLKKALS